MLLLLVFAGDGEACMQYTAWAWTVLECSQVWHAGPCLILAAAVGPAQHSAVPAVSKDGFVCVVQSCVIEVLNLCVVCCASTLSS
jgi:hypothetical protein